MFCNVLEILDPGFHRDDRKRPFSTFYETINLYCFVIFVSFVAKSRIG